MGGYGDPEDCLSGGGEMGAAMRAFDWAATPLGPATNWPQSLRTSVSICLNSRFALLIWWGPGLLMLYNDAYSQILGAKHPSALGSVGRAVWPEIWDTIGPMLHGVMETGDATRSDDLLLLLERNGYPEECYFTFSYSAIPDGSGGIGGVFTPVAETTEKVIGERRLRTLRDLASRGARARPAEAALKLAAKTLSLNPHDIPFALLYRLDEPGVARLAATAGINAGGPASPERIALHGECGWPVAQVAQTGEACEVHGLAERFGALPCGAWNVPPHSALVLPVTVLGREAPLAVLVAAVSPRKALDEQYRTFYNLVAGQVTAALSEALAYEQERKRAEALAELNRAKSHFLSNVSHEFRTPLTLMLGPLEDAIAGRATGPEPLEMVHRNGLRLLKLVNALLDFSRIEAGRVEPELAYVDLATLTAEIASTFRSLMERGGLRFTVDCPPLERPVAVDRKMWEKIVLNLLFNAFKYTPAGEVAVSLRTGGGRVELCVRDTGVGIPEDELPRVFERFHRVHNTRGRTHEGAGIGLALVHELAKLHGGTVTVTSREGEGSAFTVSLPITPAPALAAEAPPADPESRGLSAEEVLGHVVWDVFPDAVRAEFYPQYHVVMNEHVPVHFEVAWGDIWLDVYAHPTPEGMSAYILDVTGRKKTEDALRQSEERYRFLAEALPQFVWIGTPDGRTEFLNRQWYEYTGMAPGAEAADAWVAAVHPGDLERRREAWRRHSAAGEAYEMEYRLRCASDGRYRWCLSRHQPIRDAAGRIVKWIGTAIDIDDRKRAEEAMRESEQRAQRQFLELENLYKTAPIGLCFVDTGLRFLRINQQLADMHGLAPEAHLGLTLREVAPSLAPVIEPLYERVLASGEPINQVEVEADLPAPYGKRIWLVSIVPLVVDGELVGINKVVQDITSRRHFEEQLRQTQKLEAIGILAGGVAHDFNNLLTGILGNASLAAEMLPANSPAQPMLEELITASERAADLTRQLLAYSGKGRYLIEPVDLSRVVEEISMLVRTSIPRNVDLRLDLASDLPSMEGDAVQIQQLVMNLVINAAEAVDAGSPGRVIISTGTSGPDTRVRDTVSGETLPAGQYVYARVEDNGHGMDETTRARIFDPFFTTKLTGRGLGLAAALGIVRGHRGAIQLTTKPGEGTTFMVFFPAAQAAVAGRIPVEEAASRSLAGSGTILVVDDEDVVRGAARSALERYGYRVLMAENGARAVELFRRYADRVDAVLLDMSMPVMDGTETIRRLRAIRPRVPVVVTSGFDEREAMRRFRGETVDAFLQKPYRAARVAEVVRDVLAPRFTRTSAPE